MYQRAKNQFISSIHSFTKLSIPPLNKGEVHTMYWHYVRNILKENYLRPDTHKTCAYQEVKMFFGKFCSVPNRCSLNGSVFWNNGKLHVFCRVMLEKCQMSSKLTIKTPQRCHRCRSGVFFVNFEHISYLFLVFPFSNDCCEWFKKQF